MVFGLAIIGDACTGKSTYKRYLQEGDDFNFMNHRKHNPTNYENNFMNNFDNVKVGNMEVEILDTPGQSLFLERTSKLLYGVDGVVIFYDKNNLSSKSNVLNVYLPIIENINQNRKNKIHVSVVGNKDDLGGKHTFRNSSFSDFHTKVNLFSMSLRNETIVSYGNNISSWWRTNNDNKSNDLLCPIKNLFV